MASTTTTTATTQLKKPYPKECIALTVDDVPVKTKKAWDVNDCWRLLHLPSLLARVAGPVYARRLVHGTKVGLAMVLVSLLYMLDVVHDRLGDNAMWAIMTVVVMFELTSGATIGKGVNRGIGTVTGGGLGMLVALSAHYVSLWWGKAVIIATSLFIFCGAATYSRMIPKIKNRYDYGVLIFILTFSLIAVTGVRGNQIIKLTTDRLSAIFMGFVISICTNLFIFPIWAGDELHASIASKFKTLAPLVEENVSDYFKPIEEKSKERSSGNFKGCITVLYSKTADESLANFSKWEPWHGRFGLLYPWDKYLEIGEQLRDLAITILSLRICMKSNYGQADMMAINKEKCKATGALVAKILGEMGAHFEQMIAFEAQEIYLAKLEHKRQELSMLIHLLELKAINQKDIDGPLNTYVLFVLMNIVDKLEELVKKVGELDVAVGFGS